MKVGSRHHTGNRAAEQRAEYEFRRGLACACHEPLVDVLAEGFGNSAQLLRRRRSQFQPG